MATEIIKGAVVLETGPIFGEAEKMVDSVAVVVVVIEHGMIENGWNATGENVWPVCVGIMR